MLLMEKPAEAARLCGLTRLTDTLHGRWIREMVFGQGDMTLLAHRGSYKTTCLSFAMAVMLVVYPRKNLLFLRKTDSDVLEVLRQVKLLLATDAMQELTGRIYGSPVQVLRGDAENGAAANLVRIRAAEGAHVVLVQVQLLGNRARRWNAVAIEQGTSARVEQVRIELGGSVVACGARTLLNHNKCEYDLDAVYFGHGNDVLDFNDVSVHTGRDTLCEMHTAGVLTGSADKILRGTVDFQRGAKRGVGHESEDVLLFSPSARNRTAPLILCGEEEVEGQHAASVGRLDENKLYYLRSRGLSEAQARRLMVDARFAPAIDKIPLDSLQDEVRENVARRLNDELDG